MRNNWEEIDLEHPLPSIEQIVDTQIARHSVAFGYKREREMIGAGSGVLARLGSVSGVLTCGHVIRDIEECATKYSNDYLYVMANGPSDDKMQDQRIPLYAFSDHARVVKYSPTTEEAKALGPDIGFLTLSKDMFNALASRGSVLDLNLQAQRIGKPAPRDTLRVDLIAGHPSEEIATTELAPNWQVGRYVTAVLSGDVQQLEDHEGFDRYSFEPNGPEKKPASYKGVSGGGVWSLFLRKSKDGLEFVERRFVGVAFYQTDNDVERRRLIVLHGPKSVYRRLLPMIRNLAN